MMDGSVNVQLIPSPVKWVANNVAPADPTILTDEDGIQLTDEDGNKLIAE